MLCSFTSTNLYQDVKLSMYRKLLLAIGLLPVILTNGRTRIANLDGHSWPHKVCVRRGTGCQQVMVLEPITINRQLSFELRAHGAALLHIMKYNMLDLLT